MNKSGHRIKTIAKKEVVEFVRDWRTIVAIIIIPILMFPVLFIVFPILLESEAAELDSKNVQIEIQFNEYPDELIPLFNTTTTLITEVNTTFSTSLSNPLNDLERVRGMEIDAVLRLNYSEDVWYYSIIHLSTSESSSEAKGRILNALLIFENNITAERIDEGGLDVDNTLEILIFSIIF